MQTNNKIKLVIGPSSVGKSTFIKGRLETVGSKVLMAHQLTSQNDLQNNCIIHYNSFRPFQNSKEQLSRSLLDDPAFKLITNQKERLEVYILCTSKSTLLKRILLRNSVEPYYDEANDSEYPSDLFFNLVLELDYVNHYRNLFSYFEERGIPFKLINSSSFETLELSSIKEAISHISGNKKEGYSKDEVLNLLDNYKFGYQKIDLPYDLTTPGQNRRTTSEMIFNFDLENKSVLDVGCAYGYFSFEAEKRNAEYIVGTELKEERFIGANIIKEIKGSNVEFLKKDVILERIDMAFDVVLLLNVIHHLKYPVYGLKVLSEMCKDVMIIEYPTIADHKFQSSFNQDLKDTDLPFIGVSLHKDLDQTFLFNDEAIRRILLEQNNFFEEITFHESPFAKDRRIAFCYKKRKSDIE